MPNKNYIVTFKNQFADAALVSKVLAVESKQIKDGVSMMAAESSPKESDVLLFEEIGACVISLSAAEFKRLCADKQVVEVVEDFEVFALNQKSSGCCQNSFSDGYQQGVTDTLVNFQARNLQDDGGALFHRLCPPGSKRVCRCEPTEAPQPPKDRAQPIPWNIQLVRANEVWSRVTGRGIKVAVIDTGIDDDHPDLTVSGGASFVPNISHWNDDQGHGTHCAGIIGARNNITGVIGVAPECELYAIKVLNAQGSGQLSWILGGMGWAVRNGMDVASMSLGSDVSSPDADCIIAYQRAAEKLFNAGCTVIAAAGNSGDQSNKWVGNPARCPGFMAVAAVDKNQQLASFSSNGPENLGHLRGVEISAPGVRVNSTVIGGRYGKKSGTSMACPHVAGAAALIKQLRPTWTPDRIRNRMKETASDLGAPGNDSKFGAGLLDCFRAIFD